MGEGREERDSQFYTRYKSILVTPGCNKFP